jgi:hypothetical protein
MRDVIATGLVVTYARPFTADDSRRKLERDDWLDTSLWPSHDQFMDLRNGLYAHTDRGVPWQTVVYGKAEALAERVNPLTHVADDRFLEITVEPSIDLQELDKLAAHVSGRLEARLYDIEEQLGVGPRPGTGLNRRIHWLPSGEHRLT